jgi:polar amino acid transport system substrate-binding protein
MKLKANITFSAVFFLFSISTQAAVITLSSDVWCPYACVTTNSHPGYMVELAQLIFEKHGHQIEYKITNWTRSIEDTRTNKSTGVIGASHSDAPDFIFPQNSSGVMLNFIWTKADSNWFFTNKSDLRHKTIGIIKDYAYGDLIDNLRKLGHPSLIKFSGNNALERMIKMLETNRLDGFVENEVVLKYMSTKNQIPFAWKKASVDLASDPRIYIAFSPNEKKSAEYADLFSKGIAEMRKNGELQKILLKYNVKDWLKN